LDSIHRATNRREMRQQSGQGIGAQFNDSDAPGGEVAADTANFCPPSRNTISNFGLKQNRRHGAPQRRGGMVETQVKTQKRNSIKSPGLRAFTPAMIWSVCY
jgi:hypothetical protein